MNGKKVFRGWCKKCCVKHKNMRQKLFARIEV